MMLSVRSEDGIDIYGVQIVSVSIKAGTFVSLLICMIRFRVMMMFANPTDTRRAAPTDAQDCGPCNVGLAVHLLAAARCLRAASAAMGNSKLHTRRPQQVDAIPVLQLHHILHAHRNHVVIELLR